LGLAGTALAGSNPQEAFDYYNRVLEVDPTSSEAWFGKGKAAGWQSTLGHIRVPEMLVAFNHAIATAPDSAKQQTISLAVNETNRVATAVYQMARKHMLELVSLQKTWTKYLEQVSQLLDCLETVSQWLPSNPTTLENIVHLCKDNIQGVTYRDFGNHPRAWYLSPQYESAMRARMDAAAGRLRALDPVYAAPEVQKKQMDACFLVTAAMGDFHHPTVTLMRKFRDERILTQWWGPSFVNSYYRFSPGLAGLIQDRPLMRKGTYLLIVAPLTWLARRLQIR
jgi:uncharacterized glyoxalase superfamily protein PhnB